MFFFYHFYMFISDSKIISFGTIFKDHGMIVIFLTEC
jgi:hypothetical protein